MLRIEKLRAGYGGSLVLDGIDLEVEKGTVLAVLGRNGMGKTTLLRSIMGLIRPSAGRILLSGQSIVDLAPFAIARRGLAYVPQGRAIFGDLTVEENLRLGVLGKPALGDRPSAALLDHFPVLAERRTQKAGTLSGGEQQQLAIARALAGRPALLLLDEPSEGIQPSLVAQLGQTLKAINETESLTIVIVERSHCGALGRGHSARRRYAAPPLPCGVTR
jgi:ABC-type branched-subunit amino acid transport system ATPase component